MRMVVERISLFILVVFFSVSCTKVGPIEEGTPSCIEDKIVEFNKNSICDDANVKAYDFLNETVYVFEEGSCGADLVSSVYDNKCNKLGDIGGFSGNTSINGTDFSHASYLHTVWEK
jgi:hypothetical protein